MELGINPSDSIVFSFRDSTLASWLICLCHGGDKRVSGYSECPVR